MAEDEFDFDDLLTTLDRSKDQRAQLPQSNRAEITREADNAMARWNDRQLEAEWQKSKAVLWLTATWEALPTSNGQLFARYGAPMAPAPCRWWCVEALVARINGVPIISGKNYLALKIVGNGIPDFSWFLPWWPNLTRISD